MHCLAQIQECVESSAENEVKDDKSKTKEYRVDPVFVFTCFSVPGKFPGGKESGKGKESGNIDN